MCSFVLAAGWLFIVGLHGVGMLVLSIGGDGWVAVLPFVICSLVAMVQRLRGRTGLFGSVCVALAAVSVAIGTAMSVAEADKGHGYVVFLMVMIVASLVVVADGVDRVAGHHRAPI